MDSWVSVCTHYFVCTFYVISLKNRDAVIVVHNGEEIADATKECRYVLTAMLVTARHVTIVL